MTFCILLNRISPAVNFTIKINYGAANLNSEKHTMAYRPQCLNFIGNSVFSIRIRHFSRCMILKGYRTYTLCRRTYCVMHRK